MGCFHAEQPMRGKESVRPAIMSVSQTAVAAFLLALEEDAPQAPPYPTVQTTKHVRVRSVFEVFKPPARRPVDARNDHAQAVPMLTRRLGPNRVLEPLDALVARPALPTFEVVAQKVEALLGGIDKPGCRTGTSGVDTTPDTSPLVQLYRLHVCRLFVIFHGLSKLAGVHERKDIVRTWRRTTPPLRQRRCTSLLVLSSMRSSPRA